MGYIEELRDLVGHRPLIFVGALAIIVNDKGKILLQQRTYPNGVWGLPGGLMELGESTEQVAKREVLEETGLTIDNLQLLDVYSGADQFVKAEKGDEFYVVTVAYYTYSYQGELVIDPDESITCSFFDANNMPDTMVRSHRAVLDAFLERQGAKN
ncbi:NUDIX hydrolase [Aquibacillus koreensis]|uniref:NUDIX hydrolase n=1 Tax=Aquibacillus koreensis TaxID=279446 RepID=A0A9X3WL00_9BACI|nr:NUDIX hydrolase [Aquibacillus koreensis]MCT2535760.1 NUDIX hydrolase [Aquibacillus koreensis]MDC3420216.1 NUDIX hydrolase [Aquibacillus koreensis]